LTPRALARARPSVVRAWINSFSNSASPPNTVSISRPCGVVVSAVSLPRTVLMSGVGHMVGRPMRRSGIENRLPSRDCRKHV
jgi:hypothetical protein